MDSKTEIETTPTKKSFKERIRDKSFSYAEHPRAGSILFWNAFFESSFFPIPPDILLAALVVMGKKKWWVYAWITTIGSLLGGLFGYFLGFYFFELAGQAIINAYNLSEEVRVIEMWYKEYAFWAVFVSAFTYIPYKLFTITAGLFHVDLFGFTVASFIGRGLRFVLVGYLFKLFGAKVGEKVYQYFNILSLGAVAALLLLFLLL